MGGHPTDDPRDANSGRESLAEDDRGSHTGPVGGAFGADGGKKTSGSTNEVTGVAADRAFDDVQKAKKA